MRILRVGDPHVKVSNIDEWDNIMAFISQAAIHSNVERIEILGDLFHTHAILRLEVLEFWKEWLSALSDICEVVVLVGNHDQTGDFNSQVSAVDIFSLLRKKNLKIVNQGMVLGNFGYLPYIHDNNKFISHAKDLHAAGAKVLVSHTTYSGSKYESGIYAPDGVDPEDLPFGLMISGHIHSRQRFATSKGQQVIYPGTSRWDTDSDANEPKGLWLVDHDADGNIVTEDFIDTSPVATPIVKVDLKEGESLPEFPTKAKVTVNLVGSSNWISEKKIELKGKFGITSKITDQSKRESRKAGKSLEDFILNVFPTSYDKAEILKAMKEFGLVQ